VETVIVKLTATPPYDFDLTAAARFDELVSPRRENEAVEKFD
jgi:hypothetical protein